MAQLAASLAGTQGIQARVLAADLADAAAPQAIFAQARGKPIDILINNVPGPFTALYYASKAFVVSFAHAAGGGSRAG